MNRSNRTKHIDKTSNKGEKAFNIITIVLGVLAHVSLALLVIFSYKYYGIELSLFLGIIGVLVCVLIIVDILFFVGFNYNNKTMKIINCVLVSLLLILGIVGIFYVSKVNQSVEKVIENEGVDQYETINGTFTYYVDNVEGRSFSSLDDLKDGSLIRVGVLYDDGVGTGSLAKKIMDDGNINAEIVKYNTIDDLLSALVGKDEDNVLIGVFPSSYRQRLSTDENVDYNQYLDKMVDFYNFDEKVKTGENEAANKDLSTEPFNILLIGFAPEDEAMTYGLADSIIVATVNPKTLTVSMTSIARDSYVPISCYGGTRDKINAARGTSRQCLMDTVGDLLDLDINYYMEVNFKGVVQIVDAVGGIVVNNPVEFVGQTASGIRGEMTVWVPAGESVPCDGAMALAFARERHAMPNGDFDRQKHQQEVITKIVEKLIELKDVNKALAVMEAAGDNMTTNLSLNQLTGIFNYIITRKSNAGLSKFNMIDIQNMRVTGYPSWTYNYSMRLPLWIYKLYNGSIQEAKDRIADVMNLYTEEKTHQPYLFTFFDKYPYNRGQLFSDTFNEVEEHEELPSYYPTLTGKTYQEAMTWAASNGVSLNVSFIDENSSGFIASQNGLVVEQYPRQGALVSEWPNGTITVMGTGDPNYVPSFTVSGCDDKASCELFASKNGINVAYENVTITDGTHKEGDFAGTNFVNGNTIKKNETLVIYLWKEIQQINIPSWQGYDYRTYSYELQKLGLNTAEQAVTEGASKENNGYVCGVSKETAKAGDTIVIYYYNYVQQGPTQEQIAICTNQYRTTNNDGTCGTCLSGYHDESGTCVIDREDPPVDPSDPTDPTDPTEPVDPVNPEEES